MAFIDSCSLKTKYRLTLGLIYTVTLLTYTANLLLLAKFSMAGYKLSDAEAKFYKMTNLTKMHSEFLQ